MLFLFWSCCFKKKSIIALTFSLVLFSFIAYAWPRTDGPQIHCSPQPVSSMCGRASDPCRLRGSGSCVSWLCLDLASGRHWQETEGWSKGDVPSLEASEAVCAHAPFSPLVVLISSGRSQLLGSGDTTSALSFQPSGFQWLLSSSFPHSCHFGPLLFHHWYNQVSAPNPLCFKCLEWFLLSWLDPEWHISSSRHVAVENGWFHEWLSEWIDNHVYMSYLVFICPLSKRFSWLFLPISFSSHGQNYLFSSPIHFSLLDFPTSKPLSKFTHTRVLHGICIADRWWRHWVQSEITNITTVAETKTQYYWLRPIGQWWRIHYLSTLQVWYMTEARARPIHSYSRSPVQFADKRKMRICGQNGRYGYWTGC